MGHRKVWVKAERAIRGEKAEQFESRCDSTIQTQLRLTFPVTLIGVSPMFKSRCVTNSVNAKRVTAARLFSQSPLTLLLGAGYRDRYSSDLFCKYKVTQHGRRENNKTTPPEVERRGGKSVASAEFFPLGRLGGF